MIELLCVVVMVVFSNGYVFVGVIVMIVMVVVVGGVTVQEVAVIHVA